MEDISFDHVQDIDMEEISFDHIQDIEMEDISFNHTPDIEMEDISFDHIEDIDMEDISFDHMEGIKKVLMMVSMGKLATIVEEEMRTSRCRHVRYWSTRWWRHLRAICKCCCCLFVFSLLYKWRTFRSIIYTI